MNKARATSLNIIKKLLECRHQIFKIAEDLEVLLFNLYKRVRPDTTSKFFQNYFKDAIYFSIFKVWDIKRKEIVHANKDEDEIYAMTDSDNE
mmetsp:Transcript_2225/g.2886  ORF Transcript_2225/g.2886 Transcript_2225/m.2886 type:complete len:92 (+) Transcript_2225:704-979(+)